MKANASGGVSRPSPFLPFNHNLHCYTLSLLIRIGAEGETRAGAGMDRLAEAKRMVDAFTNVGADRFDLTHTHLSGESRGFRRSQTPAQIHTSLPYLLDSAPRRQNNIILRPHSSSARLIQLDDLSADVMETVKPLSFLTLATSPGSYQAWIAVEDADADFARRLRKGTGADISASGAVRLAGSHNFKPKYAPTFPVVTI
ncbi:MAG: DNA-primase RepB domain-containing protein, partial [Verrucomicrobiota bacterium]